MKKIMTTTVLFLIMLLSTNAKILLDESTMEREILELEDGIMIDEIVIRELDTTDVTVYFGTPPIEVLGSGSPIVYITEHYEPDVALNDANRMNGQKRLDVVIKNAKVLVENGIIVRTDRLSIHRDTFLSEHPGKQVDHLSDKGVEMFWGINGLIIRGFDFSLDSGFDRGFHNSGKTIEFETKENEEFFDVIDGEKAEYCKKIGFIFVPGFGYDSLEFFNAEYATGIAYSRNDNYESASADMEKFAEKSRSKGIIPIVKLLGNIGGIDQACIDSNGIDACSDEGNAVCSGITVLNCKKTSKSCNLWYDTGILCEGNQKVDNCDTGYCFGSYAYNEKPSSDEAINFITRLKEDSVVNFIQVYDDIEKYYTPGEYAGLISTIKSRVSDIKIISASMDDQFLESMLDYPDFWENIDYFSADVENYESQLQKIRSRTKKDIKMFVNIGKNDEKMDALKLVTDIRKADGDDNVIGIQIATANYWNRYESYITTENVWMNETGMKENFKEVLNDACR
ncbi:MAG: hypothetical protein NDI94_03115 [Candidatus Woesearchaeota archaeon]|nr:hypothetical protein [Candidatus Woesearchaeota archaeon]